MAEVAKWYVVHTYSGYENTVKATIERTVESRGLQEQIHAVSIPLETVTEVTESGATKTYDRKVFPGYVLVKMIMSDDAWYVIKNVRGVTGFVGPQGKAWPLDEDEVRRLRLEEVVVDFDMEIGDSVKVVNGPFEGLIGVIKSIDRAHQKVGLVLNMFGRETAVEMDFVQVEALK